MLLSFLRASSRNRFCAFSLHRVLLRLRFLGELVRGAWLAERVLLGAEGGRLDSVRVLDPGVALRAQARQCEEGARELEFERDRSDVQSLDLAELGRGAVSVVRRVRVVGEVESDVVLARGRLNEGVLGVERLDHEYLDPEVGARARPIALSMTLTGGDSE